MNRPLPLKYNGYSIVFQEVPGETSLAINISGCTHNCDGCHSEFLRKYEGIYLQAGLEKILHQYKRFITCVCFMGGEQNVEELLIHLRHVKEVGLKTCVYSGTNNIEAFSSMLKFIDYLKIGSYKKTLGGLNVNGTNQRMYHISNNNELVDITYKFTSNYVAND